MGRLDPLTSQALGRSPYDDVVPGEGPANLFGYQQMYDERGRPINPETKRIIRDVIRSHNEVMEVIGVAEPENGVPDAQAEAALRHHQYEDRIGQRLLLVGGVLETASLWGVNGMRKRILLYKEFSHATFYGMFQLVWKRQSLTSYFLGGLPSFVARIALEQLSFPASREYPVVRYMSSYIRLHLAAYTVFQRMGIIPLNDLLPNWRFFVPGTSISLIPLPPAPDSFGPGCLLQWASTFAVGLAPFAGFYLYTKAYSLITRTLRFKIYSLLPHPQNTSKSKQPGDRVTEQSGADMAIEYRTDEPLEIFDPLSSPSSSGPPPSHRRQSTVSLRSPNTRANATAGPVPSYAATGPDEFASDDEEAEIIGTRLISFDFEASEPMPDPQHASTAADNTNAPNTNSSGNTAINANTPDFWSAELRPNIADSGGRPGVSSADQLECPAYRENMLTRLPAVLATSVLAIAPAHLLTTSFAGMAWLPLARSYMARLGLSLEGVHERPVEWMIGGGAIPGRGLVNMLGLELLLTVVQGEAWSLMMLLAERFKYTEEEWTVKEAVKRGGEWS